jgi:hypothetical protein
MRQTEFSLSFYAKIIAEIAVLSWSHFYCHGTTTLFHNQKTAPLRMLQTVHSFSWQRGAEKAVLS